MGLAQAGTHYQKLKLEVFITETVKTIDLVLAIISLIKEKAAHSNEFVAFENSPIKIKRGKVFLQSNLIGLPILWLNSAFLFFVVPYYLMGEVI